MVVIGKQSHRYEYVDVAKGIAIIGVYFGHHALLPNLLTDWFWSFHMPLFFFITGLFSRKLITQETHEVIKSGIKKLVLPFLLTETFLTIALLIMLHKISVLMDPVEFSHYLYNAFIIENHPIWFLLALFYGRCIISFIYSVSKTLKTSYLPYLRLIIVVILFLVGWKSGAFLIESKLTDYGCLCKGLLAPIYIYIGIVVQRLFFRIRITRYMIIVCAIILLFAYKFPFNMYYFDYPLGVLNIMTSLIICISLLIILRKYIKLDNFSYIYKFLQFVGKNTLFILCAHTVELILKVYRFIPFDNDKIAHIIIFILILCSILIFRKIPIINRIYQLSK